MKHYYSLIINSFITFLFILFSSFVKEYAPNWGIGNLQQEDSITTATIIVSGDAMMHMPQINAGYIDSSKSYYYSSWLKAGIGPTTSYYRTFFKEKIRKYEFYYFLIF